ncbi:hypothetical protein E2C01_053660 [Portunus trituberculatus]|uniref:Uncharacterized protein n=1 Tax=Portunus trituberculatus TaxID=210409 RepID=A0A5B7GQ18_PORTR|nr:hypothetical protein [Portunus trituberculatus]
MSLPRLRDNKDFSPYSSSAECTDEDKTSSSSALLEADVEGSAVAGSARFTDLKKEDMEKGPAVELSAADVERPAVAGLAHFLYVMSHFATPGRIWVLFLQGFTSLH